MIVQYSRDENGNPDGVLVAKKVDNKGTVLVGWSACHKADKFKSKEFAKKIAKNRIKLGASGCTIPMRMKPMIKPFMDRCERYFKTDAIVLVGGYPEV